MSRRGPSVLNAACRIVVRTLGLHLVIKMLPLAVLVTAALIPLTYAWTSFVTESHWWSSKSCPAQHLWPSSLWLIYVLCSLAQNV
jgi:hypothetical protein